MAELLCYEDDTFQVHFVPSSYNYSSGCHLIFKPVCALFCSCCRVCTGLWWRFSTRMITYLCLQKALSSLLLSARYYTFTNTCVNLCMNEQNIKDLYFVCLFFCVFSSWLQWIAWYLLSVPQMLIMTRSFTPLTRHQWVHYNTVHKSPSICMLLCIYVCVCVRVIQPDAEYFKIDLPSRGEVILSKSLDYETKTQLHVTIHAMVSYIHSFLCILFSKWLLLF